MKKLVLLGIIIMLAIASVVCYNVKTKDDENEIEIEILYQTEDMLIAKRSDGYYVKKVMLEDGFYELYFSKTGEVNSWVTPDKLKD